MKNILLDIDGVIADFYVGFAQHLNENHGCSLDLNSDPSSYSISDWGRGVCDIGNIEETILEWIMSDGMRKLPTIGEAKEFFDKLEKLGNVHIVTARVGDWKLKFNDSVVNKIKDNTIGWLNDKGISTKNLNFEHDKISFCKNNKINIMIEDKLSTAIDAARNGIKSIIVDRKYNKSTVKEDGMYRAFSFDDILRKVGKSNGIW